MWDDFGLGKTPIFTLAFAENKMTCERMRVSENHHGYGYILLGRKKGSSNQSVMLIFVYVFKSNRIENPKKGSIKKTTRNSAIRRE